jgi:UDP-N-acetylmuramoyl-L-alanyl-D-glutamate--2,6-diaminopimelate ligase
MTSEPDALSAEARPSDPITLANVAREVPGASVVGDGSVRILGVHHDSRRVRAGDLFVARRGASHDGNAYVPSAIAYGAAAVMLERGSEVPSVPAIFVDDVNEAMAFASAAVYGHPAFGLDIVGITGTNGKTTTTHLVRAAIDGALGMPACGIIGTIGHTYAGKTIPAMHTTPESDELARVLAVMKKRGATHVAMEVSSIALVLGRVRAVRFRVAAFTNLTQDHLDFHRSMDSYASAKMELFTTMAPGLAVVNVDDPFGAKIAAAVKTKVLRVRTAPGSSDADIAPERVVASASGMVVTARTPSGKVELATRLVGRHNVENLLVAIGIVSALELDVERAAAALSEEPGAPGRLERCDGPEDDVVVLVDYAHTPDALGRVLDTVKDVAGKGRVICVFGCGGDRDPTKRAPMGEAVGARADVAIVTSDNPRTEDPAAIARPVENGVRAAGLARVNAVATSEKGYLVELERKRAIELAIDGARPGDVVLVAGKGHEDYQIVGQEKRPFDDRAIARAALATRRER